MFNHLSQSIESLSIVDRDVFTASLRQAMRSNDYTSLYVAHWFVVIYVFWCIATGVI